MPNNKYGIAGIVFLSTKFTIDTIKKHIEASKKYIHLIFSFFMIFFTSVKFQFVFIKTYHISSPKDTLFSLLLPLSLLSHPLLLHLLHTLQILYPAKKPAYAPGIFPHQTHSFYSHPTIPYISYAL